MTHGSVGSAQAPDIVDAVPALATDVPASTPTSGGLLGRVMLVMLIFLLALMPRLGALGEATTEDEDQWMRRSGNFAAALDQQSWRQTYQIGHPGVTTMWVTVAGLGVERARQFSSASSDGEIVTRQPGFLEALRAARVPFAILGALLVTACCALSWRLFGPLPGLTSGVLLGLDPYWVAMSPIVGMDSLLAGLVGSSLLSGMLVFWGPGRRAPGGASIREPRMRLSVRQGAPWAVASGVLAGLALLTKGPALFLLPSIPLIGLVALVRSFKRGQPRIRPVVGLLLLWGGGIAFSGVIWPALVTNPADTTRRMLSFIQEIGTTPHAPGNFFFGQPVVDPGPLFYPVAALLRLGPGILLGLLALAYFGPPKRTGLASGFLLVFVAVFRLGLTMSPKKVDRYVLAIFPALGVLAGLGWSLALVRLPRGSRGIAPLLGLIIVGLLQLWPLAGVWPHPLAAYNPLAGGMATAVRTMPVGWGEGLDQVADYLATQSSDDALVVGVWYPLYVNFQAHASGKVTNISFSGPGRVVGRDLTERADVYVDYIHARQRGLTPEELVNRRPDFVVAIGGAEYARVYRLK